MEEGHRAAHQANQPGEKRRTLGHGHDIQSDGTDGDLKSARDIASNEADGRKKITKQEAEQLLKERREKSKAKAQETFDKWAPQAGIARVAVTTLCGLAAIGIGIGVVSTAGKHDQKVAANNEIISSLKTDQTGAQNRLEKIPDASVMVSAMSRAGERAHELVDEQNKISRWRAPDERADDQEDIYAEYGVMTDNAKRFFTERTVSGGDFLPNGPWFSPTKLVPDPKHKDKRMSVPLDANEWEWRYVRVHDVNDDGSVPVLFEARRTGGDKDGELLAWMKATYEQNVDKFSTMIFAETSAGAALHHGTPGIDGGSSGYSSSQDDTPLDKEHIEDMIERGRDAMETKSKERQESGDNPYEMGKDYPSNAELRKKKDSNYRLEDDPDYDPHAMDNIPEDTGDNEESGDTEESGNNERHDIDPNAAHEGEDK